MEIIFSIYCTECGSKIDTPVTQDEERKLYLSDSIERRQAGFYSDNPTAEAMGFLDTRTLFSGNLIFS